MPRVRTKPVNRFIQGLVDEHKLEDLKDLTRIYPIPYGQLIRYADITDGRHKVFESLRRDAQALGMTTDEFLRKLLDESA